MSDAKNFLRILSDEGDFTFQTFDDVKGRKDRSLAQVYHGKLDTHIDRLRSLNELGAGIYVCINETDLEGRKENNIKRVRGFFMDRDNGDPVNKYPLEPTMIVQSKNGPHAYWILNEPVEMSSEEFSKIQKAIALTMDSDPVVSDLPRVMRIPGFDHVKNLEKPYRVIFKENTSCKKYTLQDIYKNFKTSGIEDEPKKFYAAPTKFKEIEGRGVLKDDVIEFLDQTWGYYPNENQKLVHAVANLKKNNYSLVECIDVLRNKGQELDRNTQTQIQAIYKDDRKYPVNPYFPKKDSWQDFIKSSEIFYDLEDHLNIFYVQPKQKQIGRIGYKNVKQVMGKSYEELAIMAKFEYNPTTNCYKFFNELNLPVFNTYQPPKWKLDHFFDGAPIPKVDKMPKPYKEFFNHLFDGNEESIEYAVQWMASAVQGNRNIPILSLVGSNRGIGKNVFVNINTALHGKSNAQTFKQEILSKEFNYGMLGKTLIHFDEVSITKEFEFERIKAYTNSYIAVEGKGIESDMHPFFGNIILTNNNEESLRGVSDQDDRQFSIPIITNKPLLGSYKIPQITRLFNDNKLVAELAAYLFNRPIDYGYVTKNLKTEQYKRIIKTSMQEWQAYILQDMYDKYFNTCISIRDLQQALKYNLSLRGSVGRVKLNKLCSDNPDKLAIKRIDHVRHLIFSEPGEAVQEFTERVEALTINDMKGFEIIKEVDV